MRRAMTVSHLPARKPIRLMSAILGLSLALSAAEPVQVTDINHQNGGVGEAITLGDHLIFVNPTAEHGSELWLSDGTVAGTQLLTDINPGSGSASPARLSRIGDEVWFVATDGEHGREVWITDGSVAGTRMLVDIANGSTDSEPADFTGVGELVFFSAETAATGRELWVSDGTAAGTRLVKDLNPGTGSSIAGPQTYSGLFASSINGSKCAALGDQLVFAADDGSHGRELWLSDGTSDGTQLIADLASGSASLALSSRLVSVDHGVFFFSSHGGGGLEPWATDGTAAGTRRLKDIRPGSTGCQPFNLCTMGGQAYFLADDGTTSRSVWHSDGSSGGTALLQSTGASIENLAPIADWAIGFSGNAPDTTFNWEPWISYGSSEQTRLMGEVAPGGTSSNPNGFAALDESRVAFLARQSSDGPHGVVIFDGSSTEYLTALPTPDDIAIKTNGIRAFGTNAGLVFFLAGYGDLEEGEAADNALFVSDGTSEGTRLLLLPSAGPGTSNPRSLMVYDDKVVFTASPIFMDIVNSSGNYGLYSAKLGVEHATLVKDINPRRDSVDDAIAPGVRVGQCLLFGANDGTVSGFHGRELWRTDGTTEGTSLVKDIHPGHTRHSQPHHFRAMGDYALFATRHSGGSGVSNQLWRSDGTTEGTTLVKEINGAMPALATGISSGLKVGDQLFFSALSADHGRELFVSNGTPEGTRRITDINPGSGNALPIPISGLETVMVVLDGLVYFPADDGSGFGLWRTDGTAEQTERVIQISSDGDDQVDWLCLLPGSDGGADRLLFAAADDANGVELWISDGTPAGTQLVKDLRPGSASSRPKDLTLLGDQVLFTAEDDEHGRELWATDGTAAGTSLIADIWPDGTISSEVRDFVVVGDQLVFNANDGVHGRELWQSDGTSTGTFLVADILPGINGSNPFTAGGSGGQAVVIDGILYFPASNSMGTELWAYQPESSPVPSRVLTLHVTPADDDITIERDDGQRRASGEAFDPQLASQPALFRLLLEPTAGNG